MFSSAIAHLLHRQLDSHKYDFGHVLIIGGSAGMVGAPLLASHAAMRSGAGLVSLAALPTVITAINGNLPELMTLQLENKSSDAKLQILDFIKQRKVSVVVIGPGMIADDFTVQLVSHLLVNLALPLIIDGGGLAALAKQSAMLEQSRQSKLVLTPHLGELERLVDKPLPKERSDLTLLARDFARDYQLDLVVKGQLTYVAHADGSVYKNSTGNPGLATAGSGDVLSGIIAAVIGQGIDQPEAVELAVYLHGLAGDYAAARYGQPALLASDIIASLPKAFLAQH